MIFGYAAFALFPLLMAYAAVSDLVSMTISNKVSLALLAGFAVAVPLAGIGWADAGLHIAAGAAVLVVGFLMFAAGWIGGGDAKIAAVAALWLGFGHILPFLMLTAVCGGVLTLGILTIRRALGVPLLRPEWAARLTQPQSGIPYGVALAAAALLVYPQTGWVTLAAG